MEPIRVHIAELVVADDPAKPDTSCADIVTERATSANIAVVGRAVVKSDAAEVRARLQAWIDQADIDVVIVTMTADSPVPGEALKPLVDEVVPGFTDLFRWLAFQEVGAAAMHSFAEAARCKDTFVFVLPAVTGAVRNAMDKLILPQLDARTKPKNLVTRIPRLAPLVAAAEATAVPEQVAGTPTEAVPTTIGPEKTASGVGIVVRPPARRSPTGQNVVRKDLPGTSSDVTKQIDRATLEREVRASSSTPANEAVTKPSIDIRSLLPRVPPGADDIDDEDELANEVGDITDLTSPAPPASSQPLARVKLAQRTPVPIPSLPRIPKPADDTSETTRIEAQASPDATPTKLGVVPAKPAKPAAPVAPAAKQVAVVSLDALAKAAADDDAKTKVKSVAEVKAERDLAKAKAEAAKPEATKAEAEPAKPAADKDEPAIVVSKKPTDDAPTIRAKPDKAEPEAKPVDKPARAETTELGADDLQDARASTQELSADDLKDVDEGGAPAVIKEARTRPPTKPPLPATRRPPTEPPPVPKRPPTGPVPIASARRPPTGPVPIKKEEAPIPSTPLADGDELPRGKFVYPTKKAFTVGKLLTWALLALLAAAGGIAFVHFFIMKPDKPAPVASENPPPPPPPVADAAIVETPPVDAAVVVEVTPDAPEVEIEVPPPAPPDAAVPSHPPAHPTHVAKAPRDAGVPVAKTMPDAAIAVAGANTTPPPPSDPTCDEVSCVLEKYARPCCARYKPADSGFKPKAGLPDELDKTMVKAGVERVKPRVIACGEKGGAKGIVKISLTVGPDGVVKDASVVESPAPELGTCVATALRAAKFDKSAKGGQFTYPFMF